MNFGFSGLSAAASVSMHMTGGLSAMQPKLAHTNLFAFGYVSQVGGFTPKPDAQWKINNPGNGKANVDIGNYELQFNEANSEINIINKSNGEVTRIWGDPHIDWNKDGKTDADFWGKTTFQLEDGTKITINTEKFKNNPKEYLASEVTVTRGEHALKITGLSQNELGDMKLEYADRGGQLLDWAETDGFVVKENSQGEGWISAETGKLATQKDFDVTKPGAEKPYEFTQEFGRAVGAFLLTGKTDGLANLLAQVIVKEISSTLREMAQGGSPRKNAGPAQTAPQAAPQAPAPKAGPAPAPVQQGQAAPAEKAKPSAPQSPAPVQSKGMPDTRGMSTQQKYDVYANYIQKHGDAQAKKDLANGKAVAVALRKDSPMNQGPLHGKYDDRIVVIQKTPSGPKVAEMQGNTEPNRHWTNKHDGTVGRLASNQTIRYEMAHNRQFGKHMRPVGSPLAQRDTNGNMRFDPSEKSYSGKWGGQFMYIHKGGVSSTNSQGCQTMSPAEYNRFMNALGNQQQISYVLIDAK